MMPRRMIWTIGTAFFLFLPFRPLPAQDALPQECGWTRHAQIYSSAHYVEEAGDVVGQELAVWLREDKSIEAGLYDYEGAPNTDGIRLTGKISGAKLNLQGDWVQHLSERPSHQATVQTAHVQVTGTLDNRLLRGKIRISGVTTRLTMKRQPYLDVP